MSKYVYRFICLFLVSLSLIVFQNCSEVSFQSVGGDSQSDTQGDVDPPVKPSEDPQVLELPIIGDYASIAYEDNVASPSAGDRDYNDAVFNYSIKEQYNSLNQLTGISIKVKVREKISGNNHDLHLYFNGNPTSDFSNITHVSAKAFIGKAKITVTEPDGSVQVYNQMEKIRVLSGTSGAVGDEYVLDVEINHPEVNQVSELPEYIDFRKYRFVLQNQGQNLGIDIAEINSTDEMVAVDGYPLGFMIPTDWQPPAETQLIDEMYSNFVLYRNWLSGDQSVPPSQETLEWFLLND